MAGNLRQLDNIVRHAYAIMIADRSDAASPATLSRRHVEQALGYELRPEALGLVATLWRAARAFVSEAERREASGVRLPLDVADAFRGLVLCAAIDKRRGLDAAFVLLDQASLLKSQTLLVEGPSGQGSASDGMRRILKLTQPRPGRPRRAACHPIVGAVGGPMVARCVCHKEWASPTPAAPRYNPSRFGPLAGSVGTTRSANLEPTGELLESCP